MYYVYTEWCGGRGAIGEGMWPMADVPKASRTASAEKIFDRLTVLVVNHELLLSGAYGPLTAEQKAVLSAMIARSREVADLLREIVDR